MASKNFSQILKELRLKAGYSQREVYKHFKIPQSTFSSWEIGKSEPSGEMLIKLCEFYKCDMMKEFSGISNDIFTVKEIKIIEKYRELDQHGKEIIDKVLEIEINRIHKFADLNKKSNLITLKYSSCKASAGTGAFLFDDCTDEDITVLCNEYTRLADICICVSGDSMEPKFSDGDILLVRNQPAIEEGEYGIFIKGDQGYVKKKGTDRLISLNPEYADIYPESEGIYCYGKVIGKLENNWIME